MSLAQVNKYIKLTWYIKKLTLLSAIEYRISFTIQILGTFCVDFAFLILWIIFFTQFPQLGTWNFEDTALLLAIGWFSYALNALLAGGIFKLSHIISNGEIDYYLVLPHNILWNISVSKTELSSLGNLMAMLAMFLLSGPLSIHKVLLFIIISLLSAGIFFNFMVITQSITFYVGNFELIAQQLMLALISFIYYPQVIFSGVLKLITMTIIPAYFVGFLPVRLIKNFNTAPFLLLVSFWLITLIFALIIFFQGIKRYESGSLM